MFELARVTRTSVAMIERDDGALLERAHAEIAGRLDALKAELETRSEAVSAVRPPGDLRG